MLKRTVAILASTAVLALLITPPAEAAGPDDLSGYAAGSSATALAISLLDQTISFASTTAAVGSEGPDQATPGPLAAADGAAMLIAGAPQPSATPSSAPGGLATNKVCPVGVDVGELTGGAADGLAFTIGCVDTAAAVTDGSPVASSGAGTIVIDVTGLTGAVLDPIVQPLIAALDDVLVPATEAVLCEDGGLLATLGVCDVVNQTTQIDLNALVDEIVANLGELGNGLFTVAKVGVSPSLSQASATGTDGVRARAGSTGVFVELFPGLASSIDELTGLVPNAGVEDALLTLRLGNSTAEVVRDPVTGEPAANATAAQLLGVTITDSLGVLSELVNVEVPALLDSLAEAGAALSCDGGVLADIVCIDLGTVNELDAAELEARGYSFGEGTVGREATAANIAVLPVLGNLLGGESVLGVQLSQASAAANAIPAAPTPAPPTPRGDLPKTGGDAKVPLALGLFAAAAAGIAAVRRARHV